MDRFSRNLRKWERYMRQYSFYKNGTIILLIWSVILCFGCFNVSYIASQMSDESIIALSYETEVKEKSLFGFMNSFSSHPPVVNVSVMERDYVIDITNEDYENMLRIVEAEAGGEDMTGKLLVANVIINRVQNDAFPDTVTEVIFQRENGVSQFSPIRDGRFYQVSISDETVEAVEAALYGQDESQGALYFMARKYVKKDKAEWFDKNLNWLFEYGGHEFFS